MGKEKRMDRRENFMKAVNFEEPERVPIDCSTHCGIMKQKFVELAQHFGVKDPEYRTNVVGMCSTMDERVWKNLPVDTRTVLMNAPDNFTVEDLTPDVFRISDYGFAMRRAPLYNEFYDLLAPLKDETAATVASSKWWPNGADPGRVRGLRDEVKKLNQETDFVLKLETPTPGLMEMTQRMRGLERWFTDLALDEDFANRFLDKVVETQKAFYTAVLEEIGDLIQVVEMADDFGMQTGLQISRETYQKYFKPRHKEVWSMIHDMTDAKLYLHSCGAVSELIPDWIECGLDIIQSLQPLAKGMDAATLKKKFGGKIVLWGGLDEQRLLPFGTPEQIEAEVERIIGIFAPGGGYVFAPAHVLQPDQPLENIFAMMNAAVKYGRYPIGKA
jgi:uroporphyrinogen decarboxylase